MALTNLEQRLQRLAAQHSLKAALSHGRLENAENLVIRRKETRDILVGMGITHVVRAKGQDAARQHFLHKQGLQLPS